MAREQCPCNRLRGEAGNGQSQRINLSVVRNAQRPLKLDLQRCDGSAGSTNDTHGFSSKRSLYFLRKSMDQLAFGSPALLDEIPKTIGAPLQHGPGRPR